MQISGGRLEYGDKLEKSKKVSRIILIAIILIFILIVAIICTILYIQKDILKIYINGQSVSMENRNNYN